MSIKWNVISLIRTGVVLAVVIAGAFFVYRTVLQVQHENKVLKQIVERLEADTRLAEVLVTGNNFHEEDGKTYTTIKFLEYDSRGRPLKPKYFTFSGNIIQFQSLVVRFDDIHVRYGDKLKGKSAALFWKVFVLDGKNTQEYVITEADAIPDGYKTALTDDPIEETFWKNFWDVALNEDKAKALGVKNAQIEAPGTMFIPGKLYTIRIEHDGGLRIDASSISPILRGENIM